MSEQELDYWQAQYEQLVVITCEPDPCHDIHEDDAWLDELNEYYCASRGA